MKQYRVVLLNQISMTGISSSLEEEVITQEGERHGLSRKTASSYDRWLYHNQRVRNASIGLGQTKLRANFVPNAHCQYLSYRMPKHMQTLSWWLYWIMQAGRTAGRVGRQMARVEDPRKLRLART